jgi:hypothetical protein
MDFAIAGPITAAVKIQRKTAAVFGLHCQIRKCHRWVVDSPMIMTFAIEIPKQALY